MNFQEALQKVGLSTKESAIYITLVELGPATISGIAKTTGLHRPAIYSAIPRLQQQGLVTISPKKGKQRQYAAESPLKLRTLVAAAMSGVENTIDELGETYSHQGVKPIVKFLEGPEGVKRVLGDVVESLKRGEVYYRITSAKSFESLRKYRPKNYSEVRDKKQLQRFVIASEYIQSREKNKLGRAVKVVPKGSTLFDHDINQIIYGDKVAYVDYKSLTGVIIENKGIADHQREIFKLLYQRL